MLLQNQYSELNLNKPNLKNTAEALAIYDAARLKRHMSVFFQFEVFHLLVFCTNSEMAGCIS